MAVWLSVMVLALALFIAGPVNRAQYLRVWLAMMAGMPLAHLLTDPWAYIAIDLAIAAIVMMRPKASWQRAIGLCYIGMALLTTGYMIRGIAGVYFSLSPVASPELLQFANDCLGWAATAVLVAWGGGSVLGVYWSGSGDSGDLQASRVGRPR